MAKKEEEKSLQPMGSMAMARPDFIKKGDVRGADYFTRDDIQLPRLALGQGLSPQLDPTSPQYIEGLKMGEMYDNLTGINYKNGPLTFTVLRADPPRGVEFFPRSEGGGVKDFNVPLTDIRMQFTRDGEGKVRKPIATKFYDYVIALINGDSLDIDVMALSLKGSGLKSARALNGLMAKRDAPSFAGKYTVTSAIQKNSKGVFGVFQFANAGWVTEEQFRLFEQKFEQLKGKDINFDREPGDDTEDDDL